MPINVFITTEVAGPDPKVHALTGINALAFNTDERDPENGFLLLSEYTAMIKPADVMGFCRSYMKNTTRTMESIYTQDDTVDEAKAYLGLSSFLNEYLGLGGEWGGRIWSGDLTANHDFLHNLESRVMGKDYKYSYRLFPERSSWTSIQAAIHFMSSMGKLPTGVKFSVFSVGGFLGVDVPDPNTMQSSARFGIKVASELVRIAGW